MKFEKVKSPFFFYLPYYLISLLSLLGLKLFYSSAKADALTWILAPTAGWVSVLSGIPFTYVAGFLSLPPAAACSFCASPQPC